MFPESSISGSPQPCIGPPDWALRCPTTPAYWRTTGRASHDLGDHGLGLRVERVGNNRRSVRLCTGSPED